VGINVTLSSDPRDDGCFKHLHQMRLKEGKAVMPAVSNVLATEKSLFCKKQHNHEVLAYGIHPSVVTRRAIYKGWGSVYLRAWKYDDDFKVNLLVTSKLFGYSA